MKRRQILLGGGTIVAVIAGITLTSPEQNQSGTEKTITTENGETTIQVDGYATQPTTLLLDNSDFNTNLLPNERETLVNEEIPVLIEGRKGILVNTTHTTVNSDVLLIQGIGVFENRSRAQEHYRTEAQQLSENSAVNTFETEIGTQSTGGVYQIDSPLSTVVFRDTNITVKVGYSDTNTTETDPLISKSNKYANKIATKINETEE